MAIQVTTDISQIFVWAATNQKSLLVDYVSATQVFVGVANDVSNQGSPIFTVFQITLNANGLVTVVQRAEAVTWTGRAGFTYK